jgi:hypothetical protein
MLVTDADCIIFIFWQACENWAQIWQVLIKFGRGNLLQTCQANWIFGHPDWIIFPTENWNVTITPLNFYTIYFSLMNLSSQLTIFEIFWNTKILIFSILSPILFHSKSMQFTYNKVVKKVRPSSISDYQCCQHIILLFWDILEYRNFDFFYVISYFVSFKVHAVHLQ